MRDAIRLPVGLLVALIFAAALAVAVMIAVTIILAAADSSGDFRMFRAQLTHYFARPALHTTNTGVRVMDDEYGLVFALGWLASSTFLAVVSGNALRRMFPRDRGNGGESSSQAAS
jgi:hypothetical protein